MFQTTKLIALSRLLGRLSPHLRIATARPAIVGLPLIINSSARLKHNNSSDRRDRSGGGKRKATSFNTTNPDREDNDVPTSTDYDIFNDK